MKLSSSLARSSGLNVFQNWWVKPWLAISYESANSWNFSGYFCNTSPVTNRVAGILYFLKMFRILSKLSTPRKPLPRSCSISMETKHVLTIVTNLVNNFFKAFFQCKFRLVIYCLFYFGEVGLSVEHILKIR